MASKCQNDSFEGRICCMKLSKVLFVSVIMSAINNLQADVKLGSQMPKTKEIELKLVLPQHDHDTFVQWLNANAVFLKEETQCDQYFDNAQGDFYRPDGQGGFSTDKVLRIRTEGSTSILCFKQWHRDAVAGKRIYCDEFETEVANGQIMEKLLAGLGYKPMIVVSKKRKSFSIDQFVVALDEVEELGTFVEIELACDVENPAQGLASIYDFLTKAQVKNYVVQSKSYSAMVLERKVSK